jgi:hypothetical protein
MNRNPFILLLLAAGTMTAAAPAKADGWAYRGSNGVRAANWGHGPYRGSYGGGGVAAGALAGLAVGAVVGAAASRPPVYAAPPIVVYEAPPWVYAPPEVVYAPGPYYYMR